MARVFDLIEYPDTDSTELVHRFPESGSGDFRIGSQLVVRESQSAVFFRDGKVLDRFGPGRHTIVTANIPLVVNVVGALFDGKSPFTAEVYFVNMRQFLDKKWGTSQPIALRDSELGMVRLRAFGTYSMQVIEPRMFIRNIAGVRGLYKTEDIEGFLRGIIITRLTDLLGTEQTTLLDLPQRFDELSATIKAKVKDDFAHVGIAMRGMYIESINPTEDTQKAIDERAAMGAIGNMQAYLQFKAARALGDAAQQGGDGGAGLTGAGVGLGAGMGLGGALASAMGQAFAQGAQASTTSAPATPKTVACPACQAPNPAGANFCSNCGSKIAGVVACPNCHVALPPGAKFCSNCGAKIG